MKILVIWQDVPEILLLYILDVEETNVINKILAAHNNYMNSEPKEVHEKAEFLYNYIEHVQPLPTDTHVLLDFKIDAIVLSGCIL